MLMSHVCREKRQTSKTVKKCARRYCCKCDVGLCIGQCFEVYHKTVLLGVKVTIEFQKQCCKNLISVQCVNCSGNPVTINFVIPASKFPLTMSGSKIHVSIKFFVHEIHISNQGA